MDIKCPTCKAEPGKPCVYVFGHNTGLELGRLHSVRKVKS
jgi:hypothetical protein